MERRDVRLIETKADDARGSITGYGAVFGNLDEAGDVIREGAFTKSLADWREGRGKRPKMLLNHGGLGIFGGGGPEDMLPVGQWTDMEENSRGLKVEGKLFALNTERGQYIYEGLKAGELDGLSIGYQTIKSEPGRNGSRVLTEIKLHEVSIVTFPANPRATVTGVKTLTREQWRDLEDALYAGGLSRADCKRAMPVLRQWLQRDVGVPGNGPREVEAPPDAEAVLEALTKNADALWSEVFRR